MPALILSIWFHVLLLLALSTIEGLSWNKGSIALLLPDSPSVFSVVALVENNLPEPLGVAAIDLPASFPPLPLLPAPQIVAAQTVTGPLSPILAESHKPASGGKVSPPTAQRYYRTNELDVKPQIRVNIDPEFPLTVDPGTKGKVVLLLFLDREGNVESAVPVHSTPKGVFDDAALTAFRQARYTPGLKEGMPVNVLLAVEVEFESDRLK